ncbi:MAG: hypothetical protein LBI72_12635 [Flavobacteriaceae bacterium]|jgi:hypothetical protein|nr:hypothetical protein [Flavobacteriaceae bacterium]
MGKYFIFNAKINKSEYKEITVIFNPDKALDVNSLSREITEHFSEHYQTEAILFLYCSLSKDFKIQIEKEGQKIFMGIPKIEEITLNKNIFYASYKQNKYNIGHLEKTLRENFNFIINQGLTNIFVKNGGLVESNGVSHHFVFPSGKHSAKFLRTANILVKKSEIDFIALNTLHKFNSVDFKNIYCDTLSINVIAYSMSQLVNRYNENHIYLNIESFKSYDGLYSKNSKFLPNSIFLISASTSGGIIQYLKENHGHNIHSNNIIILYYLPIDKENKLVEENVLCNLDFEVNNQLGLEKFVQYKPSDNKCKFCENNSTPIKILGDSFSLDEPIINTHNIVASKYISKEIKDFVEMFKCNEINGTVLKVSYNETSIGRKKYDLYIDYEKIIANLDLYEKHKNKLNSYIDQYVPASIKYIIHLNDNGSKLLSEYIKDKIKESTNSDIIVINQSDLKEETISNTTSGSILIVGSCITNGKNLLYLSRFFRNYEKIRLVYFVAINRISDTIKQRELKNNIKIGLYGLDNSTYVEIESIHCDNSNKNISWELELEFLKKLRENSDENNPFVDKRISTIQDFEGINKKGGDNNIFFTNSKNEELKIRKNSAFFNNNDYHKSITQSDVYFTISCVLNNMRNNKESGLFQTNFVRNLLDPYIFNRFNDGVIQASILRASKPEELNYSYSIKHSASMLELLLTIIKHKEEFQGEALYEFLFALAIGKLRLLKSDYVVLIDELKILEDEKLKLFIPLISEIHEKCL